MAASGQGTSSVSKSSAKFNNDDKIGTRYKMVVVGGR